MSPYTLNEDDVQSIYKSCKNQKGSDKKFNTISSFETRIEREKLIEKYSRYTSNY
jgi:hypothetical protein